MKRITKWLVALMMAICTCFPAFTAIYAAKPVESDTAPITVTNGPEGGKVTAYPVLVADYSADGFLGYKPSNSMVASLLNFLNKGLTLDKDKVVDESDVQRILTYSNAQAISALRTEMGDQAIELQPEADSKTTYTANVPAGAYVIVVENAGSSTRVYNVGTVSVGYSGSGDNATLGDATLDLNGSWSADQVLKSQDVTLDKEILNYDDEGENNSGAAFDQNEAINFQLSTAIPSYNLGVYNEVIFTISDSFSEGLEMVEPSEEFPFVVKVGGQIITDKDQAYTLETTSNGFKLAFNSEFILDHGGLDVTVSYWGKITGDQYNFDGTNNTANLEYSNNPEDVNDTESIEDKTYQYTFAIDGTVNGTNSTVNEEIVKVNENFTQAVQGTPISKTERLEGAQFGIWAGDSATGDPLQTVTTDENGLMNFKGLDQGNYVIKEIKAPDGYSLNDTLIPVSISAVFGQDGKLQSYEITINGESTNKYEINYENETIITNGGNGSISFPVKNTKIPGLPSTGSTGTVALTIGGVVLIGGAAVYFMNRKKKEQDSEEK